MGLDMYAYTTPEDLPSCVDFNIADGSEYRLHYWRKHPNLHGWMEALYTEKGGSAHCFNCVNLQLERDDLDRLEADVKAGNLPHTTGFFFGASDGNEKEDDLAFINKAREAIASGLSVFYSSWW